MYTSLQLSAEDMNSQAVTLKHNNIFDGLERSNSSKHRFGFSKTSPSSLPSVRCENLCAKCFNKYCHFEESIDISKDIIFIRDSGSFLRYQQFRDDVTCMDGLLSMHNEMLSMEKETGKRENMIAASVLTEIYDCDVCNSGFKRCMHCQSKICKDNQVSIVFEIEKDFKESLTKVTKYDAMTADQRFPKYTNVLLQRKSLDETFPTETLIQSVPLANYENLVTQKCYTEDKSLLKISNKSEKLPNSGDSLEVTNPDNCGIKAEKVLKNIEISEDIVQDFDYDKKENDKFKYISTNIKPNNPVHQYIECYSEEDNSSLEYLLSVFDFLRESEAASYFTEEQNAFTFSQNVEPECKISSFYCVQSVGFLLSCLNHVDKNLMEKEKEAIELKHYFETKKKELESSGISKTMKCKVFEKLEELKRRSGELLEDLQKDKVECNWYSKNINDISIFLQKNCLNQNL